MTPRDAAAGGAPNPGAGGRLPQPVWLVVDGTVPLEPGLAQTAIRLAWTGHFVTVVLALPGPRWTLNARLADRQHRELEALLRVRHDELADGLRAGLGEGPCPRYDGDGRISIRWTSAPPPRLVQRIGRLRNRLLGGPDRLDTGRLQQFTGLPLTGMPPRISTPVPPRAEPTQPA